MQLMCFHSEAFTSKHKKNVLSDVLAKVTMGENTNANLITNTFKEDTNTFKGHIIKYANWNKNANAKEALSLLGRNIRRACIDGNDREVRIQFGSVINPIWCGGGLRKPPLSYKWSSPKKINGKSCQFFFTFPNYVNGVLETTFCSQITIGLAGRGQKWSKLA